LCLVLARSAGWAWGLLVAALLIRVVMAVTDGVTVLHDKSVLPSLWLLPVRDLLAPMIWIGGLFGRKILWRGEKFELQNGKLKRSTGSTN